MDDGASVTGNQAGTGRSGKDTSPVSERPAWSTMCCRLSATNLVVPCDRDSFNGLDALRNVAVRIVYRKGSLPDARYICSTVVSESALFRYREKCFTQLETRRSLPVRTRQGRRRLFA